MPRRSTGRNVSTVVDEECHEKEGEMETEKPETISPQGRTRRTASKAEMVVYKEEGSDSDSLSPPQTAKKRRGPSAKKNSEFGEYTDEQCFKKLKSYKTSKNFMDSLIKKDQELLARGAIKFSGGALKCFECPKTFTSSLTYVFHLKKCDSSLSDTTQNASDISVPMVRTAGGNMVELSIEQLKQCPYLYHSVEKGPRVQFIERQIVMFREIPCPSCGQLFSSSSTAISHFDSCIEPEYFTYKGRISELRRLNKSDMNKLFRNGLQQKTTLPCLVCGKMFGHIYGLEYHITRCGLDPEERPWRCHHCGYVTTQFLSRDHLSTYCEVKKAMQKTPPPGEFDRVVVRGKMGEIALRTGKKVNKNEGGSDDEYRDPDYEDYPSATVDIKENADSVALEKLFGAPLRTDKLGRIHRNRFSCSIATGQIPERSSRISVGKGGALRFKFRKLEVLETVANAADRTRYGRSVADADKLFVERSGLEGFSSRLHLLPIVQWEKCEDSPFISSLRIKQSIGIRRGSSPPPIPSNVSNLNKSKTSKTPNPKITSTPRRTDVSPSQLVSGLTHLNLGEGMNWMKEAERQEEDCGSSNSKRVKEWTSVSYAGGPVNSIDFSPNRTLDGSDVFAVSCYSDDETLIGRGNEWRNGDGYVQLWTVDRTKEQPTPRLWCILGCTNCGMIMRVKWCAKPNTCDTKVLGYLAVGTAIGQLLVYRIDFSSIPIREDGEEVKLYTPEPSIILEQDDGKDEREESSPLSPSPSAPPITSIDWAHFNGANKIAACNAAGFILIWELDNEECPLPIEMTSDVWLSPAVDVVWNTEKQVAVSFRERLLRVLDIDTGECVLEEATVRTAGSRVTAQLRVFPGCFLFQSEYFATGESAYSGSCYLVTDGKREGYFVVPLSNRHELMTWDLSACSSNGILVSCGVDGSVLMSINGRLAPLGCKLDYSFSAQRKVLQLTSFRIDKPSVEEGQAPPMYSTHEESVKNMWLDINFSDCDRVPLRRIPYSSGDLRIDSLNVTSVSYGDNPVAVIGGQAGLLFMVDVKL